eukprot:6568949-Prymnesium_polylepis.1
MPCGYRRLRRAARDRRHRVNIPGNQRVATTTITWQYTSARTPHTGRGTRPSASRLVVRVLGVL